MNLPNVIKLTTPFERVKLYSSSSDVALRKAIITQAIIDATNVSNDPEAKKLENEAKQWIFKENENFFFYMFRSRCRALFYSKNY